MAGPREARDRELFDTFADHYGAKDFSGSSRTARRWRLEQTIAAVPAENLGCVLEIGCGGGFAARYLQGRYRRYVGIDHSRRLVDFAAEVNAAERVRFEVTNIDDFEPPEAFDLIFMVGVLHHLENAAASLATMARWLAPGGFLVANEPQPANPLIRVARRARARIDGRYSSEQEEISADELRGLLGRAGLEDIVIVPQGFVSTPFAEVVLRPEAVFGPISRVACKVDGLIEKRSGAWMGALSWNLIGRGRAPGDRDLGRSEG